MKALEKRVKQHLAERGWDQLRPSDVAKSIMIEGGGTPRTFSVGEFSS